jgi:hypothetical protein
VVHVDFLQQSQLVPRALNKLIIIIIIIVNDDNNVLEILHSQDKVTTQLYLLMLMVQIHGLVGH